MAHFHFHLSHEVDAAVSLQLGRVVGCVPGTKEASVSVAAESPPGADVFLEFVIGLDGHQLSPPLHSPIVAASTQGAAWEPRCESSCVVFPFKIQQLLPDTVLGVSVWVQLESSPPTLVGSAVMPFFNKRGRLKTGFQSVRLVPGAAPDLRWPSQTPGRPPRAARGELGRLEGGVKRLERGDMAACSWLDRKTLQRLRETELGEGQSSINTPTEIRVAFLLPAFPGAVLYSPPNMDWQRRFNLGEADGGEASPVPRAVEDSAAFDRVADPEVALAGGASETNPCEFKALKLSQAPSIVGLDRDAKPSKEEVQSIRAIVRLPPVAPLTVHQKTLVTKYRHYLARIGNTAVPFLKSVDWQEAQEAAGAVEALQRWQHVSTEEALQILTFDVTAHGGSSGGGGQGMRGVCAVAVDVLRQHCDDLQLGLLMTQLVMLIKADGPEGQCPLADFLVERAVQSVKLAVEMHWKLLLRSESPESGVRAGVRAVQGRLYAALEAANRVAHCVVRSQLKLKALLDQFGSQMASVSSTRAREELLRAELTPDGSFAELLTLRVACPADPHVLLLGVIPERCKVFKSVRGPVRFVFAATSAPAAADPPTPSLGNRSVSPRTRSTPSASPSAAAPGTGPRPGPSTDHLEALVLAVATGASPDVATGVQQAPGTGTSAAELLRDDADVAGRGVAEVGGCVASPRGLGGAAAAAAGSVSDGSAGVTGAAGLETGVVEAQVAGLDLTDAGEGPGAEEAGGPGREPEATVQMLWKQGDDLRQDQFVCQLILIMDRLLKRENLDLRLTPYWVLPMSPRSGILEFVPSTTLQDLTGKGKVDGVLRFLAEHNPRGGQGAWGEGPPPPDMPAARLRAAIAPEAMQNFIRSNAGYAIISYLLDMGDRHQENILIAPDGKLFHIDFGTILGMRDPKQWAKVPVPVKRDIIAAMGGQLAGDYKSFRKLAVEAYIILRKHSNLLLTLLACMAGSEIQCFVPKQDGTGVPLDFALAQMEDRFKVHFTDDEARTHIFTLIDQSIANLLATMGDTAHRIAIAFRQ